MERKFRPSTVSVLGCGWLGLPLLRSLGAAGYRVRGSSRNPETLAAIEAAGAEAFFVDLPGETPRDFLPTGPQNTLIITLPPRGRALGEEATANYLACLRSIPLLQTRSTPRVIFTSSTGVYGAATGLVDETRTPAPDTHSARAVLAAEEWLATTAAECTILRLAGLVAEDRHPGRFYGGRDRVIPRGDAPINLVHREDVISAILLLLDRGAASRETYNVCAGHHPPKGAFYRQAAARLSLSIAGSDPGGAEDKVITSDKLRALGWAPQHDKFSGLA